MKTLLLFLLMAPLTGWAQEQLAPRVVRPKAPLTPTEIQQAITKMANPRYFYLPLGTFLYRNLRDTVRNHYASPLPAGEWQLSVLYQVNSRWLAVRWLPGSAPFAAADTAVYYMPAMKGAQNIIRL